jgi:hypothetical protein
MAWESTSKETSTTKDGKPVEIEHFEDKAIIGQPISIGGLPGKVGPVGVALKSVVFEAIDEETFDAPLFNVTTETLREGLGSARLSIRKETRRRLRVDDWHRGANYTL